MTITCEAAKTVQIVGYETECKCEHCGRKLKHGIKISDGRTVGATCLDQKMTKAKDYHGKKYRVGASWIVNAAKIIERRNPDRWYDMGVSEHGRTFELVDG